MDLAIFIGELLGVHGEVCVPGLGCFVKTRINSRFDEKDNRLYPPSSQVLFDPQTLEDDTLIEYISEKKHISVSSAKYFVEKYIANLKEQIALYEVAFTDIGWLYTENGKLSFKAKENLTPTDPDFFGYLPVKLYKLGQEPALGPDEPKPAYVPPVNTYETAVNATATEAVANEEVPQDLEEEEYEERQSSNIWIILAVVLAVSGLAVFALYTFKPELFQRFNQHKKQPVVILPIAKKPKADTARKTVDSTTATIQTISEDSIATLNPVQLARITHWELIAGEAATKAETNNIMATFQKMGLNPKIIDAPGPFTKISIGTCGSAAEAEKKKDELIKTHVLQKDIYILKLNPIKTPQI